MQLHKEKIMASIESMVANVQRNKHKINNLNVFPVPDGDTGTNIFATLSAGWNNISENSKSDLEILDSFFQGALFGARGNSGVIVSQIIKGFLEGIKKSNSEVSYLQDLKMILEEAKNYAYNSVSEPVEGTILSVMKALVEEFNPRGIKNLTEAFLQLETIARRATNNTPNQLKILKESGVVDSGAFGLMLMIEGISRALSGNAFKINVKNGNGGVKKPKIIKADPNKNIGYCTEFILTTKSSSKFDKKEFTKKIAKMGDSIVLIYEDDILKLHIHSKNPGEILNEAQKYGEFSMVKVENMASQVLLNGHEIIESTSKVNIKNKMPEEDMTIEVSISPFIDIDDYDVKEEEDLNYYKNHLGIIVVSNGIGINKEFEELNVDKIIFGGQTMNPSVSSFVEQISKLKNDNILILPNNSNIILTASMVKKAIPDKNIFVLPTKSVPQGLVALYNINKEMIDFDNYEEIIKKEYLDLKEGQITIATRDTELYGVKVQKGQYIAIYKNEKIIISSNDVKEVLEKLIETIINEKKDLEILNIFYNDKVDALMLDEIGKKYKKINKDLEINVRYGGQAVYNFIVFGE